MRTRSRMGMNENMRRYDSQKFAMMKKLRINPRIFGDISTRAEKNNVLISGEGISGILNSSTRRVIAMANIPSLNAIMDVLSTPRRSKMSLVVSPGLPP